MNSTKRTHRARSIAGLLLATATVLAGAGCSVGTPGSDSSASSASSASSGSSSGEAGSAAAGSAAAGQSRGFTADQVYDATTESLAVSASRKIGSPGTVAVPSRAIIRTGRLDLRTADVPGVRADLVTEIAGLGGEVASEESSGDRRGRLQRVLIVAEVPTDRFADAMDAFAALARTTKRSADATDVTEEVVDVAARVRTQAAAVRRMEELLDRADTVGDVIRVESELVRRQAALEALQARQESLAQKTATATVRVDLQRVVVPREVDEPSAVAAGLATGWSAFGEATRAVVVLVATLLPFAIALALLGAPVLWWRRRKAPRASGA